MPLLISSSCAERWFPAKTNLVGYNIISGQMHRFTGKKRKGTNRWSRWTEIHGLCFIWFGVGNCSGILISFIRASRGRATAVYCSSCHGRRVPSSWPVGFGSLPTIWSVSPNRIEPVSLPGSQLPFCARGGTEKKLLMNISIPDPSS